MLGQMFSRTMGNHNYSNFVMCEHNRFEESKKLSRNLTTTNTRERDGKKKYGCKNKCLSLDTECHISISQSLLSLLVLNKTASVNERSRLD